MKKFLSILLVIMVILSMFSFNSLAITNPTNEEIDEIFNTMGYSAIMSGEGYFGCDTQVPEGREATDSIVFEYMMHSGALDDYVNHSDWYSTYTVPYDDYINLVDKIFVNHSDMKNYLRENNYVDYDEETGVITWDLGGSGDAYTWVTLSTSYCDDIIYATGVFAYYGYDTDGLIENKDYITINGYEATIKEDLLLTLKYIDGEWKILEFRPCFYHIVDGILYYKYSDADEFETYYSLQINANNSTIEEYENSADSATNFYGNNLNWYLPGSELQYKISAQDGYTISYVVLSDDNGSRIIDISDLGVCTLSPSGTTDLTINTREVGGTVFEEFIYNIIDFFEVLSLRLSFIFNF